MATFIRTRVKSLFFDRPAVIAAVGRAEAKILSRAGAFVMTRTRSLIRTRKAASKPGRPPSSHGKGLLKHNVFFAYDPHTKSVVIGPTLLKAGSEVPKDLEEGGEIRISAKSIRRVAANAVVGGSGPIRTQGHVSRRATKWVKHVGSKRTTLVTFAKIRTIKQSGRANLIWLDLGYDIVPTEELKQGKSVSIAPRPYTSAALEAESGKLAGMFANSVR